jgi:hypothetical protein
MAGGSADATGEHFCPHHDALCCEMRPTRVGSTRPSWSGRRRGSTTLIDLIRCLCIPDIDIDCNRTFPRFSEVSLRILSGHRIACRSCREPVSSSCDAPRCNNARTRKAQRPAKADIPICTAHVHFRGQSRHGLLQCKCPLMTQSGHRASYAASNG